MGHKNYARVARPSLRVLVMQYIQRCGGSGLVHETNEHRVDRFTAASIKSVINILLDIMILCASVIDPVRLFADSAKMKQEGVACNKPRPHFTWLFFWCARHGKTLAASVLRRGYKATPTPSSARSRSQHYQPTAQKIQGRLKKFILNLKRSWMKNYINIMIAGDNSD